jgi:hypothetical protein
MADRYSSFKALATDKRLNIDYGYRWDDRGTEVIVLVPHGGWIEPGTSQLGEAITGDDLSFYAFEGLLPRKDGWMAAYRPRPRRDGRENPACPPLARRPDRSIRLPLATSLWTPNPSTALSRALIEAKPNARDPEARRRAAATAARMREPARPRPQRVRNLFGLLLSLAAYRRPSDRLRPARHGVPGMKEGQIGPGEKRIDVVAPLAAPHRHRKAGQLAHHRMQVLVLRGR